MNKKVMLAVLLLLPQLAVARVYMCVDPETGATHFTDKACETTGSREEIRVSYSNVHTGKRYGGTSEGKTWRSEQDTRKTGEDYNAERRRVYENSATASTK